MNIFVVVSIVLMILKLSGLTDLSWFWVVSPLLVGIALWALTFICVLIYVIWEDKKESSDGGGS